MKRLAGLSAILMIAVFVGTAPATDVQMGAAIGDGGLRSFYLGIGDYYHVPEREIYVMHDEGVPDDDLPVVYFLAERARVAPGAIVDLRLRGWSWDRITFHYGLGPEIYYVPVPVTAVGPPYGHAYGYYRRVPRARWRTIHLSDDDVVNLVNLRFVSEYRHVPPERVIALRGGGHHFTEVYSRPDLRPGHGEGGGRWHGGEGHRGHGKHAD